jgi:hypothetical protein
MIRIWAYHHAPKEYRELSNHGGDEDWLAHIPQEDIERNRMPFWFDEILYGEEDSYLDRWGHVDHHKLENGDSVVIFAHA